jgi:hypothetical protein
MAEARRQGGTPRGKKAKPSRESKRQGVGGILSMMVPAPKSKLEFVKKL